MRQSRLTVAGVSRHTIYAVAIGVGMLGAVATASIAQQSSARQEVRLNRIIEKLENGKPAYSDDWVFIDMEHSPFLLDQLVVRLNDLRGRPRPRLTPMIRIPVEGGDDPRWAVKQILDLGAFGIIFPHIDTKEHALTAVQSMRYAPQRGAKYPEPFGKRGYGPAGAVRYWGLSTPEYLRRADLWPLNPDGELFAMVMIESAEAVKNIDEILKVPGVGSTLIGPHDLSVSLGVFTDGVEIPAVAEAAIQTVLKACLAHKVLCGIAGLRDDDEANRRISQGWKVLTKGSLPVWLR